MGRVITMNASVLLNDSDEWIELGPCYPEKTVEEHGFVQFHLRSGAVEYFKTDAVLRFRLKEKE